MPSIHMAVCWHLADLGIGLLLAHKRASRSEFCATRDARFTLESLIRQVKGWWLGKRPRRGVDRWPLINPQEGETAADVTERWMAPNFHCRCNRTVDGTKFPSHQISIKAAGQMLRYLLAIPFAVSTLHGVPSVGLFVHPTHLLSPSSSDSNCSNIAKASGCGSTANQRNESAPWDSISTR